MDAHGSVTQNWDGSEQAFRVKRVEGQNLEIPVTPRDRVCLWGTVPGVLFAVALALCPIS